MAQKHLPFIPTAIKYSPEGDVLAVGFNNGKLILLDTSEKYSISLE